MSCRLLALAAGMPASAGPQQRASADAGLSLALRLGLPASDLLKALKVRFRSELPLIS